MNFPKLPTSGGKLPALWATVQKICDVLPSLEVYGDNSTTFVNKSRSGTVIRSRAKPKRLPAPSNSRTQSRRTTGE